MLNIKKAITVLGIPLNNLVSLSLFIMFCWLGNLFAPLSSLLSVNHYAQMQSVPDFPKGIEFDPRHPPQQGERGISPSAISENVEIVGVTERGALMSS